jgi:hypothetical protein
MGQFNFQYQGLAEITSVQLKVEDANKLCHSEPGGHLYQTAVDQLNLR